MEGMLSSDDRQIFARAMVANAIIIIMTIWGVKAKQQGACKAIGMTKICTKIRAEIRAEIVHSLLILVFGL
jgi:hypothetical protein